MQRRFMRTRDDSGMTTAEYAVGTVGACGLGGVLLQIAQSDWFGTLVQDIIGRVVSWLPF